MTNIVGLQVIFRNIDMSLIRQEKSDVSHSAKPIFRITFIDVSNFCGGWHVINLRPASRKERQLWLAR
jgi:hypothetical protein